MKINMSLQKKLMAGFLVVGLTPLAIVGWLSYRKTAHAIHHEAGEIAAAASLARSTAITSYLESELKMIIDFSTIEETHDALINFSNEFDKLEKAESAGRLVNDTSLLEKSRQLKAYYTKDFSKMYDEKSGGQKLDASAVFSQLDATTIIAQYDFIAANENPIGSKDQLDSPKAKSIYGKYHAHHHPDFRRLQQSHGLYDLFLVNKKGRVVYSVFKETDFATSLRSGPWSRSGLAKAFEASTHLKAGEVTIADFEAYTPSYDAPASFAAAPIYKGDEYIGSIIVQLPLDRIAAAISNRSGLGEHGEVLIFGSDAKLRADTFRNKETHNLATSFLPDSKLSISSAAVEKALKGETGVMDNVSYDGTETIAAYQPLKIANVKWGIVTELPKHEVMYLLTEMKTMIFSVLTVCTLLIIGCAYMIGRSIATRIGRISDALKVASIKVLDSSQLSASSATELSEASTEQAASLQETMASIEEISAMVAQNAESAGKVLGTVTENKKASDEGSRRVEEMIHSIDDIKGTNDLILQQMEASNKEFGHIVQIITDIGEKTKVINDIVFQTKLLSFNASVEAARAGEHGKGFAVVAEEVGNLAQMSGNAAKEITDMLTGSVKRVNEIVETTRNKVDQLVEVGKDKIAMGQATAQKCREVLNSIASSAESVSSMVNEITHASKEQSQGVQEINKAISQLDQVTQQNSAVAQQSSTQAEELNMQANELKHSVADLVSFVTGQIEKLQAGEKVARTGAKVHRLPVKTASSTEMKKASGDHESNVPKFEEF